MHTSVIKQSESFIGKQADDLSILIREQIKPIYESLGIVVPVKSCSIIHYLNQFDELSITELARHLKQSHQLVKQKIPKLQTLGLIEKRDDSHDKRRSTYHLHQCSKITAGLGFKCLSKLPITSLSGFLVIIAFCMDRNVNEHIRVIRA